MFLQIIGVQMFRLGESQGSCRGLYCGWEGLYLGSTALIKRLDGGSYCVRAEDDVAALLAAAYEPNLSLAKVFPGLSRIAGHLDDGDLARAQIAALQLRFPEIGDDGIARVAGTELRLKANFNPVQPRDRLGRWTAEGDGANGREANTHDHPALRPAQEVLPFFARPPFLLEEPPKTVRPFKKPIPRLNGREGAKNIPSWARGSRPYIGENGRDFAKRLMDEKYGPGKWDPADAEYRQLQKYGDRNFRGLGPLLLPNDDEGA